MDAKEIDRIIKSFLAIEKEPIVVVVFETYVGKNKKGTVLKRAAFCGVLSLWYPEEERLMFKKKDFGSDDTNSVWMPVQIDSDNVVSIKMLSIQNLMDNTTLLYSIREEIGEEIS